MLKKRRLIFRVDEKIYDLVRERAVSLNMSTSEYLNKSVIHFLKKDVIQKSDQRKIHLLELREKHKNLRHQCYDLKNCCKRLFDYACITAVLSGFPDSKLLEAEIKRFKKEFRYFEPSVKKLLKPHVKSLDKLKLISNLSEFVNEIRSIEVSINKTRLLK